MEQKKRVLVAPLDWGLGHATRCIPLIKELIDHQIEVIIAADGRPYHLLKEEFPSHIIIRLPGYQVVYPDRGSMVNKILFQIPRIILGIYREHQKLRELIKQYKIDGVISDNRFGLWTRSIPCVFMTHQVRIKMPKMLSLLEPLLYKCNKFIIEKYSSNWIIDMPGEGNLSGQLGGGNLKHSENVLSDKTHYIGPLSRFSLLKGTNNKYDLLAILSGPEPQRTIFEKIILDQLESMNLRVLVVRGITEVSEKIPYSQNVDMVSYLDGPTLNRAVLESDVIIARSGYSTIMDLAVVGKKAILVPTPGQTEQEYLADLYFERGIFYTIKQEDLKIDLAIEEVRKFSGIKSDHNNKNLLEVPLTLFVGSL